MIVFDQKTKRYREQPSNRFVSRDKAVTFHKEFVEKQKERLISFSSDIKAGKIGTMRDVAETLKSIHISNAIIAANGIDRLDNSQLGTIGNILKKQYHLGKDEKTGKRFGLKFLFQDAPNINELELQRRLSMFALSGEITGGVVSQQVALREGKTEMRRLLGVTDYHCDDCLNYANLGWQTIGKLPIPKQKCRCLTNCACQVSYR